MDRQVLESLFKKKAELVAAEATAKQLRAEFDELQTSVVSDLEDHDLRSSAKYNGLGHVTLAKPRLFASLDKERKEEAYDWVRSKGFGELIQEQINPTSLSSVVGSLLEEGTEIPDCFSIFMKQSLRLYKSKE